MFFQDPQAEKSKLVESDKRSTFSTTVTAKARQEQPALSELAQTQKELMSTVASLSDSKKNRGSLSVKDWKGSTKELDSLKLWIPQTKDVENLKLLSKYLKFFLEPNNHKLIATKVSSNQDARTDLIKAHKEVSDYLRTKIQVAREMQTLQPNNYDAKIDRLTTGFRASFRNSVEK